MKELSIEEKAKAYDEALEAVKNLREINPSDEGIQNWVNENFPELKESEGEKIRKVLIGWINLEPSTSFNDTFDGFSKEQILAWLEKQSKPININPYEFDLHLNKLLKQFETLPKEELISILNFYLNVVQNNGTYKSDEKQGQKVDNKVEPKFKVGDWCIDNEDGTIFQIVKVLDNTYNYRTNEGKEYSCTHYSLELDARLWSISDVKEGDMLYDGNAACILRKTMEDEDDDIWIDAYCGINIDNEFKVNDEDECWCLSEDCSPATKEQCDTLMKAMADAGYTFDFEKKKLKKLKFKVGDEVITENEKSLTITKIDEKGYWSDDLFICNFDSECNWNLVEQKPVDKVEPKFKVGDWCIDNEDGTIFQIVKVLDKTYRYRTNEGKEYSCTHYSLEFDARLWNISDAKEGDVLVNGSNIFIFHFINDTRLMGYCHVNTDDGRFYDDIGKNECFCLIDAVVNPATKEQRDLLLQKMKEAGYTFDFYKKELKKIEQKPTWSEDEEDAIIKGELPVVAVSGAFHSFKDRINWKPSEEQIYWLKWAIGRMTNTEKGNDAEAVLKDLLEQLENLLSTTPKLKT